MLLYLMNSLKTPELQSINDHKLNPLSLILILNDESDESYADAAIYGASVGGLHAAYRRHDHWFGRVKATPARLVGSSIAT